MATEDRPYPDASPSLSYDLAKNALSIQLSAVDALDGKIALGLSLATTLIAILLAFLGIRTGQGADVTSRLPISLLAATVAVYLCALTLLGLAIRTRSMETGLKAEDARNQAENYPTDTLYWWATEYFIESLSHNSQQYRRKLGLATVGLMVLAVQIGVGIASIGVTFN